MNNWIFWSRFPEVVAATTTKAGGHSSGAYDSLNLAYHTGDRYESVIRNRATFLEESHLHVNQLVLCHQSHAITVLKATPEHGGRGALSFADGVPLVDSLYTTEPHLALGILHADCIPIYFYAPKKALVGIIHAGWQGTLKDVSLHVMKKIMTDELLHADELFFYFGPSITVDNLLVTDDLKSAAASHPTFENYCVEHEGNVYYDVVQDNVDQLKKLGISKSQIDFSTYSTYRDDELFYSFARSSPVLTGRHISFIYRKTSVADK